MLGISLSKPCQLEFPSADSPDVMIEKENQRMRARKQSQRPKRLAIVKDTSLDNPTPQMVEIMNKIREKSASPPVCQKRHRHNRWAPCVHLTCKLYKGIMLAKYKY